MGGFLLDSNDHDGLSCMFSLMVLVKRGPALHLVHHTSLQKHCHQTLTRDLGMFNEDKSP